MRTSASFGYTGSNSPRRDWTLEGYLMAGPHFSSQSPSQPSLAGQPRLLPPMRVHGGREARAGGSGGRMGRCALCKVKRGEGWVQARSLRKAPLAPHPRLRLSSRFAMAVGAGQPCRRRSHLHPLPTLGGAAGWGCSSVLCVVCTCHGRSSVLCFGGGCCACEREARLTNAPPWLWLQIICRPSWNEAVSA